MNYSWEKILNNCIENIHIKNIHIYKKYINYFPREFHFYLKIFIYQDLLKLILKSNDYIY